MVIYKIWLSNTWILIYLLLYLLYTKLLQLYHLYSGDCARILEKRIFFYYFYLEKHSITKVAVDLHICEHSKLLYFTFTV
jgi:hypothetical protein